MSLHKLSYELWGIDWEKHLPATIGGNERLSIGLGDVDECLEFVIRNFQVIFDLRSEDRRFGRPELLDAKRRYYERAGDFLAFRDAGRLVGFFLGTPSDCDSYYYRHVCVLPESRGQRWVQTVTGLVLRVLGEYGVSLVEADAAPSNLITQHLLNKYGFYPAGLLCTTRWGAIARYVKFLDGDAKDVFLRQFCSGIRPECRVRQPIT